jgi:hypothetical protein
MTYSKQETHINTLKTKLNKTLALLRHTSLEGSLCPLFNVPQGSRPLTPCSSQISLSLQIGKMPYQQEARPSTASLLSPDLEKQNQEAKALVSFTEGSC